MATHQVAHHVEATVLELAVECVIGWNLDGDAVWVCSGAHPLLYTSQGFKQM